MQNEVPAPYLIFTNPGEINPRLITILGTNAKASPNSIGQFGTGLKYAIAGILRLGGEILINSGETILGFSTVTEFIRDKPFQLIQMEPSSKLNNEPDFNFGYVPKIPLGFTTDLGAHWAPWMIYRELWSNCRDEGGEVTLSSELPEPEESKTSIVVSCAHITEAHKNRHLYILDPFPLWANSNIEIHPAQASPGIFYRGIRVTQHTEKHHYFTYNILSPTSLTEDRTIDLWTCLYIMAQALASLTDQALAKAILLAPSEFLESKLNWNYVEDFSPEMRAAIRLNLDNKKTNTSAKNRLLALYPEEARPIPLPMSEEDLTQVREVRDLCADLGFPLPWADIRKAQMLSPEISVQVYDEILWLSVTEFYGPNFLHQIFNQMAFCVPWDKFAKEKLLLAVLSRHCPELAALKRHADKQKPERLT